MILKQKAFRDRAGSLKGERDKIDIIAMLKDAVDMKRYEKMLVQYGLKYYSADLKALLKTAREVPEIGLTSHALARLKKTVIKELD